MIMGAPDDSGSIVEALQAVLLITAPFLPLVLGLILRWKFPRGAARVLGTLLLRAGIVIVIGYIYLLVKVSEMVVLY